MELRLLAKHDPENRVRIAAAGAVRPLIALLSHPDPLLQEHGVTALLNLSLCDENKAVIVEAGAVRPLVHALKSAASPAARENAACALLRLAQLDGSAAAAIGRAGAIPLLVSLLETGTARGKKDAATALYALCSDARENRLRAVEAGAVRPLLDLMADPESGMVDKAVAPSPSPRRLRRPPGRAERSVQESSQPPAMSGRVAPANLTSSASSSRRSSAWRASRRCRSTAWSCPQVSSRLRCSGEQDEQKGGGDGACGRFRFHLQIRFQSWWGTLARLDRETPYYRKCASFCFSFFYLHGNSL